MMKKGLFSLMVLLATAAALQAKPTMPKIFGDNMVLQQNSQAAFWGTAKKNSKVTVTASWSKASASTTADSEGKWSLRLPTPAAGGPYEIQVSDGEKLSFSNVLIGEVWLCSGQSNMEMPMRGFRSQPVEGAAEYIATAKPDCPIRMFTVKRVPAFEVQEDVEGGEWLTHTPQNVSHCSATAYFFAEMVQKVTGVPVGLVISNWGGTRIEPWLDEATMKANTTDDLSFLQKKNTEKSQYRPTMLFNSMIAPLIPYTIKGIIWYQGEANRMYPERYEKLQAAYVKMMRDYWNDQNIPFYFTQIAPYNYDNPDKIDCGKFRDAQAATLKTIPHSGMAVTLDIGDAGCIHPAAKNEVGHRLAYLALTNDYGLKGISAKSPLYKSMEVKDGKVIVYMDVDSAGLAPLGHNLAKTFKDGKEYVCFEVAGEDRVFHPADVATIECPNKIVVSCEAVPEPVAVRYCYRNFAVGDLFNCWGFPAASFRTDNW